MQSGQSGQSGNSGELRGASLCTWFGFWGQFVVLGFTAVLGAVFGGMGTAPGDQTCGVILVLASVLLMFLRLKHWFDDGSSGWFRFLLVDDMPNLVAAIVVFVVLAVAGMVVAARVEYGGLHSGAVALILASAFGIFLSIKNVFDHLEHRR